MQLQISPGIYCREAGALAYAGQYAAAYGAWTCLIGGRTALEAASAALTASLRAAGMTITGKIEFGRECSYDHVSRLAKLPAVREADVLIGVGGGKALDTVKLLAYQLGKPLITVPTVAATCAAWTPLSVVYDHDGAFVEVSYKAANPAAVLADTDILTAAPAEFIIAGIGDTLAKWYEGEACTRGKAVSQNGAAGLAMARLTCDRLFQLGAEAVAAVRERRNISAVDEVIDAIIMYAGMVSNIGGDACRAAAAHSIYSAFTILPPVHHVRHGAVVSFGILCQMMMDGKRDDEVERFLQFSRRIGLPVTLQELKLEDISPQDLMRVAAEALHVPEMVNMPYRVTAEMVADSITAADARGRKQGGTYE
jgi:glycerol dehydrogenase